MRALVIDDSRAMRAILRQMLRQIGFEVVEAGNGQEGLDRLKEADRPDVALVDLNMPVLSGFEFVKAVRADPRFDGLRLMMVTTETEVEQVAGALKAGADEYVMKPFDRAVIVEKLGLLGIAPG